MTKLFFTFTFISLILNIANNFAADSNLQNSSDYYVLKINNRTQKDGMVLLDIKSYQQTTEYTCGPAAILTLLNYYGKSGNEMLIAKEMDTNPKTGTRPEQMNKWLNSNGFKSQWYENGTLEIIRENLGKNIPVLVEWSDWGGHWVIVIGYDTRNTSNLDDDVIIFADPYDRHDDNIDGIDWFNAQRFYYMWYDSRLFGRFMKGIYIIAEPDTNCKR